MAREQSPAGDTIMKVQQYDVGSKRTNKEESLEIEEGRRQKRAREAPHTGGIAAKIKQCASALTNWSNLVFGHTTKKIMEKKKVLSNLIIQDMEGQNGTEIIQLRREINELLDMEKIWWAQRSRVQWLSEGDRNTKYFHHRDSERRRKNTITGLWNENGTWCDDRASIASTAISYFKDIYTTIRPSRVEEVTSLIHPKVTDDMNENLIKDFIAKEVRSTLQQMHPTKAPGPDGMSAIFFQKFWNVVGSDVTKMVLNVLNSNMPMDEINKTNITLVLKIKNPTRMKEFRPISLSNVTYKMISKVLANHLKVVLSTIISENQSAFLSERLITDNILVAFEVMHYLEHKKEGKESYMAIKLDMSKAYDRVEWSFVEKIMKKLGFHDKWIAWIMKCISTVSYSVLINGEAHGNIVPSRGLRQGDPLSSYLFLLCTEAFSALIVDANNKNRLNGISICRGCPYITHLFFVDDSFLFCRADSQECYKLVEILEHYEVASGQKINADKSSVFFSQNTTSGKRGEVLSILGPMQDSRHGKYLGLPSVIGKSKIQVFTEIKEKVAKKLLGWKEKMLSLGGKEILIKAVTQAIPTYTMSCFLLLKGLCEDLERMTRNFCSPSYAWRSIDSSLEVIRRGKRWNVGNGKLIHIWEDKWLPTPTTYRVCSPPQIFDDFRMVSSLIDEDTRRWKTDLGQALFLPFEADTILQIPLSYSLSDDKIVWVGNKRDVVMQILENGTSHDLELFFVTAWSIWYNWNQVVHEAVELPLAQIWGYAQRLMSDFRGAISATLLSQQSPEVGWAAPPLNTYKVNVDGATSENGKPSSIGIVIRDCKGCVVAARGEILPATYSAEVIEAFAIEEGVVLACELKLSNVILESDSIVVIQTLVSKSDYGDIGPIIQGSLTRLGSFSSWTARHLKRDYNKVAHDLAKVSRSAKTSQTWFGMDPHFLQQALMLDRSKC
ncbi:hypothetical protein SO802_029579 [Lithocarpus litseifolius]|uniref:Reverse transcriptase domain-containing protein n=1 Tax=Lithocarpus litseifolius TaxID=425828 RepID=A0AAW2BZ66_9ROSI